jgi:phospholipase A1
MNDWLPGDACVLLTNFLCPMQTDRIHSPRVRVLLRPVALIAACVPCFVTAQASGETGEPSSKAQALEHCATIGASSDRLICYDKLAGRAPAPTGPAAEQSAPGATAVPATSRLAPKDAPLPDSARPQPDTSLLSRFWELEPSDKRGIFNFVGYQPNYVLPLHYATRVNRAPRSPTQTAVPKPDYRREEAKFQLSLRTKLVQDVPLIGGDLWVAFTQQAMWQIYAGTGHKSFRNIDYQPEAIYVLPTAPGLRDLPFGWRWSYSQVGIAHQSNGQSDPLSRSWNRVYLGAGFERGDWSLTAKVNQRLSESTGTDKNPDLLAYRGRAEFQLNWSHGLHTASLLYRSTLKNVKYGGLQAEWSYPIFTEQPNGLRWFVQAFSGYCETLTDYNFRQTSLGVGVTFLQF